MSYILDALRRSQAERERGQLPGLNTPVAPSEPSVPTRRPGAAIWVGLGLALGLGLGGTALLLRRETAPSATPSTPQPVATPAQPAVPTPVAPPLPLAPAPAAATRPLPIVVSAPPPPPPPPVVAAKPPVAVPSPAAVPPPPRAATPTPAPAPRAAAAEAAPLPIAQLTPQQRRELPPLVIGGSIWSENAASRIVIINGQLVHEGEVAAPGVTLERIGNKAAVLRWRELRIEVPF